MAIVTAEKIFVDVDDEINFVVEKFLEVDNEKVIIVCPQNALIVSSQVSIKILVKQMLKSRKLLILVTEDAFGQRVAESAGLVTADKVSQITSQMWEIATTRKESLQDMQEKRKQKLLQERGILEAEKTDELIGESEPVVGGQKQPQDSDIAGVSESMSEIGGDSPKSDKQSAEMLESGAAEDELLSQEESTVDGVEQEEESEKEAKGSSQEGEEKELKGAIQRRRPQPKMVKVGKLNIMAGGDISGRSKTANSNKSKTSENQDNMDRTELSKKNRQSGTKPVNGFTGKDWTKYTEEESESFFSRLPFVGKRTPQRRDLDGETRVSKGGRNWKKVLGFGSIALAASVIGIGYLILFVFSSVDVSVELAKDEVGVEQTINFSTEISQIDEETITIPAVLVTDNQASASQSYPANGSGERGEKAAGLIEIWNKTDVEVTLDAGTELTLLNSDLKYVLNEQITLPPATFEEVEGEEDPGVTEFGGQDVDRRITAVDVGSEYNLSSTETLDFSIDGYPTSDLIGKGFRDIGGGNSEQFIAVSETNFEEAEEQLQDQELAESIDRLDGLVQQGFILLPESAEYNEVDVFADPDIGGEAEQISEDNYQFTLNLEGEIDALAISEEDLQTAIQLLIERNQDNPGDFEITGLSNAEITEVVRDGSTGSFKVISQGSLQSAITPEQIKQEIAGKNVEQARAYLEQNEDIISYQLFYSPRFVPESLQRMPTDPGRISVAIQ